MGMTIPKKEKANPEKGHMQGRIILPRIHLN